MSDFQPSARRWNIALFNSIEEVLQWLATKDKYEVDSLGFGSFERLMNDAFPEMDAFDEARARIEMLANTIDLGGAFTKSKLEITDNQSGIFDFGLASLGLQRLVEFFSEKLASEHPRAFEEYDVIAGVVPNVLVDKNEFDQYSVVYGGKTYLLEKRQKGTTLITRGDPSIRLVEKNGMLVPENATDPEIASLLGFTSSQKKSYIQFKKEGGRTPYIDLIVPLNWLVGGAGGSNALNSLLPAVMAAKFFERAGVQTRILTGRIATDPTGGATIRDKNPYVNELREYDIRVPAAPNSPLPKDLLIEDVSLTPKYECLPIANVVNLLVLKKRGEEPDYNSIGQLLVTPEGRGMTGAYGFYMWDRAEQRGAKNYLSRPGTGSGGVWYLYPSTMSLIGRVVGKWSNFVAANNLWGDKREQGSFTLNPYQPSPPLLTFGTWIAATDYDLDSSIKQDTLLLHNHPFGHAFWRIIDKAELALSTDSSKVMSRIFKRLVSQGYDNKVIEGYLREMAQDVFITASIDPLEMLVATNQSKMTEAEIRAQAVPPNYYPVNEEVKAFYERRGKEFLKSYQNMISRLS